MNLMTKLEKLIEELCPNGVEYKTLGEIATIVRGASPRPIKKYVTNDENGVNWIKIGDVKQGSKYITETKEKITKEGALKSRFVKTGDFILSNSMSFGRPYILKIDGCIHDGWLSISNFEDYVITDYFYYTLMSTSIQNEMKQKASFGGAVQNLNADIVKSIKIPLPPLEVQAEIVKILDDYSTSVTALQQELEKELTARKKQYEYYRDMLLNYDVLGGASECEWKTVKLGDLCSVITKGTTPKYYANDGVSFIKTEAIDGNCLNVDKLMYIDDDTHTSTLKRSILQENDILITIAGATIGKCIIVPKEVLPANTNQALGIIRLKQGVSHRYIFYILQSAYMKNYMQKSIKGSAQPNLNLEQLNNFSFPFPPLAIQERIVQILDRFDKLCNDISEGLPDEIEARQKQYEYYRDKLLTFKELTV